MYKPIFAALILSSSLWLVSCRGKDGKDMKPGSIYLDYKVWGDEDAGYITVRLQYRFGGHNGTTLLLEDPAKAELDGIRLKADSSRMNGIYYEAIKPVKEFTGKHTIIFTDINKKQYPEEFSFQPISLKTRVPAVVSRDDLVFDLDGLEPQDYVRVLLSDTVAFSEGVSRIDTVKNGRITITKAQLRFLANGPVHLEFSKEDEKKIRNGTREAGNFSVSYGLKRDFILKDEDSLAVEDK
ncbi:MAG: hypothetical protein Q8941_18425 [Bacteroidota bacterium]|nr:hypothetical protein [Bacteroidota bacterium]